MEFLVVLLLVLLVTRVAGELFRRAGQAPLIGEVLAGIVLGPAVLAWISPDPATELGAALGIVVALGILFLVLSAGLEVGAEGLRQALRDRTYIVAATEFVFPFGLGYAFAQALGMDLVGSLFMGTAMAVTALPVSVRILMDLNLLGTRFGRGIVSVAAANDVLAFAFLGVVLELHAAGGTAIPTAELATSVAKVLAFVGLICCVGWLFRRAPRGEGQRRYLASVVARLRTPEASFAVVLLVALAMGVGAERLGLHFAIGVFYAGAFLTRKTIGEGPFVLVQNSVRSVSLGFLAPFFFAFVGLNVVLQTSNWSLVLMVTAIAFVGKVLGGLIGGTLAGFRGHALAALAVGLNARGMMELLLAQVGLAAGIIDADLYSAIVIMTLVTTLSTPPILKAILKGQKLE
ncbi:MAG: cation:proton antiporter [Candidatus Thermoplasmatota archaeon]